MPSPNFHVEEMPDPTIKNIFFGKKCCKIYAATKPVVPVVGDWHERYCSAESRFPRFMERVYNFEVRPDDVWVVTFPKSGTTWAQELTWLLVNNLDYDTAKRVDNAERSPSLEYNAFLPVDEPDMITMLDQMVSPRVIKSHLPAWLLPKQIWTKKAKVIYLFRNPKDTIVSMYHHWRGLAGYNDTKEIFVQCCLEGYIGWSPYWPHVLDYWLQRERDHVFFTSYERMKADLPGVIKDVVHFLNTSIAEDQLEGLVDHLSFEKMKDNPACNHFKKLAAVRSSVGVQCHDFKFIRRGVVGSHKDELSPDIIRQFEDWIDSNLQPYSLTLDDFINYSKY